MYQEVVCACVIAMLLAGCGGGDSSNDGSSADVVKPPHSSTHTEFLYATNSSDVAFSVDLTTGALISLDKSLLPAVGSSFIIAKDPKGRFMFAEDGGINLVSYRINATTGALSQVGTQPLPYDLLSDLASNIASAGAVVNPSGEFFLFNYTKSGQHKLAVYRIDTASGAFSPVIGSPFDLDADTTPHAMTFDASGEFVYALNNDSISSYGFNSTTGALTHVSGSPLLVTNSGAEISSLSGLVVDSSHALLFTLSTDKEIIAFKTSGGLLTRASATASTELELATLAVDPSGHFLYALGGYLNKILAYSIDAADGTLTSLAVDHYAITAGSDSLIIDPSGQFLYVLRDSAVSASSQLAISGFTINTTTGALSAIVGSPFIADAASLNDGILIVQPQS